MDKNRWQSSDSEWKACVHWGRKTGYKKCWSINRTAQREQSKDQGFYIWR